MPIKMKSHKIISEYQQARTVMIVVKNYGYSKLDLNGMNIETMDKRSYSY